ncbi:MAG TPA: AAA family ATPase [Pyrinomonadaceae bacterium]|jgi:ATP-dependent Clp protease ATP-binding subunit ClpX
MDFKPVQPEEEAADASEILSHFKEAQRIFIEALPLPPPLEIAAEIARRGYKGQDEQRQALALMAYRHVRRLKRIHVEGVRPSELPPKQNVLLTGPTGCGKTFLVELLFRHFFKLPTVVVDITSFTEAGYVGDDVRTILTRLIAAADDDTYIAECGVVCLDEFDKLASAGSSARFAGQGTTKDVSGYGVQRELLAMLESSTVSVPMDYGFSAFGQRAEVSTRDIPFIACGAFSGLDELLRERRASVGFRGASAHAAGALTIDEVAVFQKFGFLPELIGRFARIVTFPPLPRETLRLILCENVLPQFQHEFRGEGLQLSVTDAALEYLITRSERRGTGARGLHTELIAAVERAAFETFGRAAHAEVIIDVQDGRLASEVRKIC